MKNQIITLGLMGLVGCSSAPEEMKLYQVVPPENETAAIVDENGNPHTWLYTENTYYVSVRPNGREIEVLGDTYIELQTGNFVNPDWLVEVK